MNITPMAIAVIESPGMPNTSAGIQAPPSAALLAALASTMPSGRSEEHTSELQSLMRISYAVFCLKKKQPLLRLSTIKALLVNCTKPTVHRQLAQTPPTFHQEL